MPGYYKLAVEATFATQNIVNILYYGTDEWGAFSDFEESIANDIAASFVSDIAPTWLDAMTLAYTINQLTMSFVNQHGASETPFPVVVPVGLSGTINGATAGQFITSILAFNTTTAIDADLNVKRSYLAFGPLPEDFVADNGSIVPSYGDLLADVRDLLVVPLEGSLNLYAPVRVGRTPPASPTRVGRIISGIVRPFASTRKSRKYTPRGT